MRGSIMKLPFYEKLFANFSEGKSFFSKGDQSNDKLLI